MYYAAETTVRVTTSPQSDTPSQQRDMEFSGLPCDGLKLHYMKLTACLGKIRARKDHVLMHVLPFLEGSS